VAQQHFHFHTTATGVCACGTRVSTQFVHQILISVHQTKDNKSCFVPAKALSHSDEKQLKKGGEIRVIFLSLTSLQATDSHVTETAKEMSEQTSAGTSRMYCRRGADFFDKT